jgi:hypothetical protein
MIMSISGDGLKSNVRGTEGNDDIRATTDTDGSNLQSGFGDDILRGGRFDDWLTGGAWQRSIVWRGRRRPVPLLRRQQQ